MAKKKQQQQAKAVSPEKFMVSKARGLALGTCYINSDWQKEGMAQILLTRRHNHGMFTFASFLVDVWCRGVVDAYFEVNVPQERLDEMLDLLKERMPMEEVDYWLAHNIVYGAVEYAEDAGIEPYKEFKVAQYMLEEDTDDTPYIEIEFGRNGKPCLTKVEGKEAQMCLKLLDKNIGPGNYECVLPEDDWTPHGFFDQNSGKSGVYAYKRPSYPGKDALKGLKHPEIAELLDVDFLGRKEIDALLALPHDELADDLQLYIMATIGATWELIERDAPEKQRISCQALSNAMEVLGEVGTLAHAGAVLEILRQSDAFIDFYFGDTLEDFLAPVAYKLWGQAPRLACDFMREEGLENFTRAVFFLGLVEQSSVFAPEKRDELVALLGDLLQFYLDQKDNPKVWDGGLVGLLIGALEVLNATELIPLLRSLYATGQVDECCFGPIAEAIGLVEKGRPKEKLRVVPLDLYAWAEYYDKKWRRTFEAPKQ